MSGSNRSYFSKRVQSFGYAFSGIGAFLKSEPHARIHAVATVLVIAAGIYCNLPILQWILLAIVTGLVWITEMLNTVIEKVMDHVAPQYHERVKWIKDVAAGAVLVAALVALITGGLVFVPYFL